MQMLKKITIEPISRLEGHGKVTVHLDADGEVAGAFFHVTQFRGFESFCEGRPFEEMTVITQRICGICPVSHQLASAKACDQIIGIDIPVTAKRLRELEHMGQFIQSHALHFFHLASPDLLLGWDCNPETRNVVGVIGQYPEIATQGILLRKFGQEMIQALGGKKIHPAFALPGGVLNPLLPVSRDQLLKGLPEALKTCSTALELIKGWIETHKEEVRTFANFDSLYAGLIDADGYMNLYDGLLRMTDHKGQRAAEFEPARYLDYIGEHVESWSYMKFPYFKGKGYDQGGYRVGPLGRLNVADALATPRANTEMKIFKQAAQNGLKGSSLMYHYARLIELLYCLERAEQLLTDDHITGTDIRILNKPKNEEGVGVIEAPRGTLIHHYWVDKYGAIQKVNLIVATGHNNIAINRSITLVARAHIHQGIVDEGLLNRIEGAIRCYDPCLSCATHALGQMPLTVRILNIHGDVVHERQKR